MPKWKGSRTWLVPYQRLKNSTVLRVQLSKQSIYSWLKTNFLSMRSLELILKRKLMKMTGLRKVCLGASNSKSVKMQSAKCMKTNSLWMNGRQKEGRTGRAIVRLEQRKSLVSFTLRIERSQYTRINSQRRWISILKIWLKELMISMRTCRSWVLNKTYQSKTQSKGKRKRKEYLQDRFKTFPMLQPWTRSKKPKPIMNLLARKENEETERWK